MSCTVLVYVPMYYYSTAPLQVNTMSEWLTYEEAAKRLNSTPGATRVRALRKAWPKRIGNSGKAEIKIPEGVEPYKQPAKSYDRGNTLQHPEHVQAATADHSAELVAELRSQISDLRDDRDHLRVRIRELELWRDEFLRDLVQIPRPAPTSFWKRFFGL